MEYTLIRSMEIMVAPRAGAWIEIQGFQLISQMQRVAPRAGAWIEIQISLLGTKKK